MSEPLRYGNYGIMKSPEGGRRYRAIVLDYREARRPGVARPLFRASRIGWTREMRAECRAWIEAQS